MADTAIEAEVHAPRRLLRLGRRHRLGTLLGGHRRAQRRCRRRLVAGTGVDHRFVGCARFSFGGVAFGRGWTRGRITFE
jgi:hypothetical protein